MTLLLPVVVSCWASYQLLATLEGGFKKVLVIGVDALSHYVTRLTKDHVSSLVMLLVPG
ncbi:hypothetical protein OROHE_005638 [Orobanche hederae]